MSKIQNFEMEIMIPNFDGVGQSRNVKEQNIQWQIRQELCLVEFHQPFEWQ